MWLCNLQSTSEAPKWKLKIPDGRPSETSKEITGVGYRMCVFHKYPRRLCWFPGPINTYFMSHPHFTRWTFYIITWDPENRPIFQIPWRKHMKKLPRSSSPFYSTLKTNWCIIAAKLLCIFWILGRGKGGEIRSLLKSCRSTQAEGRARLFPLPPAVTCSNCPFSFSVPGMMDSIFYATVLKQWGKWTLGILS